MIRQTDLTLTLYVTLLVYCIERAAIRKRLYQTTLRIIKVDYLLSLNKVLFLHYAIRYVECIKCQAIFPTAVRPEMSWLSMPLYQKRTKWF